MQTQIRTGIVSALALGSTYALANSIFYGNLKSRRRRKRNSLQLPNRHLQHNNLQRRVQAKTPIHNPTTNLPNPNPIPGRNSHNSKPRPPKNRLHNPSALQTRSQKSRRNNKNARSSLLRKTFIPNGQRSRQNNNCSI